MSLDVFIRHMASAKGMFWECLMNDSWRLYFRDALGSITHGNVLTDAIARTVAINRSRRGCLATLPQQALPTTLGTSTSTYYEQWHGLLVSSEKLLAGNIVIHLVLALRESTASQHLTRTPSGGVFMSQK